MPVLEHRNYFKVAERNLENIRNDIWDVNWIEWPSAVYCPEPDPLHASGLLKTRLMTVDPGSLTEPQNIQKSVLGHEINSPGGRNSQPTDVVFTWNDREDQAISFMVMDYQNQSGDPDTGFTRHVTELYMQFHILYYNTLLQQVRHCEYYNGLYAGCSIPHGVGDHGGDNSEVTLTVHCAHHKMFIGS
jgi:hypothetical protein